MEPRYQRKLYPYLVLILGTYNFREFPPKHTKISKTMKYPIEIKGSNLMKNLENLYCGVKMSFFPLKIA